MKNKFYILFLLSALLTMNIQAQTFAFEESTVPAGWTVQQNGTLALSTEHYKEGVQSLCWETTGTASLTVSFTGFIASTGNSAFLQIYTPEITNDTLVVDFLYLNVPKRTARFLLNYRGWREFNRAYTEYASNVSSTISAVRFTLKPTSAASRKIYFDNVKLNQTTQANRIPGSQWLLDKQYFTSNNTQLNLFANTPDIALTTPTSTELADLQTLRNLLKRTPAAGTTTNLTAARIFVNSLGITRNTDGTVKGKILDMSPTALTTTAVTDYISKLEVLAAAGMNDAPTLEIFRNFLDHLTDQGFAEGLNYIISTTDYTNARSIPAKLLNILPACTNAQKEEVLKLARWISYYGLMHESQNTYLQALNSDVIYLYLPHIAAIALFQTDDAVAVREMKAFKRFLDRNTEYVPGGGDILKPDGTGFHHNTHYNNYMYSYQTWMDYIWYMKGTSFRISADSYLRFRKAILSIYTMATLDTGNTRHYANTLSGRNPFGSGIQVYFSKDLFEKLILVGGDCMGKDMDEELAGAYNYFFESTKYSVPTKSYEGFHQFNYSPLGIYRRANWVATMRAPTTKFWGAEIYSNANRFGRYQSHGTLEITYKGSVAQSGYPGNGTGGGWDWNVVPGTTTVHYTSWQEMMPNKNLTDRFDQFTKTKNFSGALSWGEYGVFATDFDQIDTWGSQRFTATNLVFRKSMYAFDNMIISLGSGISSSGTYDASMITATNLFQQLTSSASGKLLLNGTEITMPHSSSVASTQDNWLLSPQGTGYFIPQGNDAVELRFGAQKSPVETGADYASPATTANAAKAYINHGVKPSGKSYAFVVIPGTNATEMQTLSAQMANGGGSIYQIHSQSGNLHALTYKPKNITAYTFYGASFNQTFGIVKSSTAEHLLMHRPDAQTGRQYFAASNPNLKPVTDAIYGWKSSSSQTTLTLHGEWLPVEAVQGVQFHAPANGETQITLTFSEGEAIYFTLKRPDDTSVEKTEKSDLFKIINHKNELIISPKSDLNEDTEVRIYSTAGQLMYQKKMLNMDNSLTVDLNNFTNGIYYGRIAGRNINYTFKWIHSK